MKKWFKILFPIICVAIVAVTFVLLFDMKGKTEKTSNENEVDTENVVENTIIDDVQNIIEENTIENETVTNTVSENTVKEEVMSSDEDRYSENKQEKAIELVKKHWGKDDTVYFTNENINSDEEYVVAVRSKTSTAVQNYFKVNIVTGKVTIDY